MSLKKANKAIDEFVEEKLSQPDVVLGQPRTPCAFVKASGEACGYPAYAHGRFTDSNGVDTQTHDYVSSVIESEETNGDV